MLCSEEKPGFKIELSSIRIIAILLISSLELFPQIPINGFCKYNRLNIDSGFTNLFSLNYNNDSYTDLVIFNPVRKELETLDGNQLLGFSSFHKTKLPAEISFIRNLVDKNNRVSGYAFSSRKRMKVGLISFAKNGKPSLAKEIKLNSYPENISVADTKGNSGTEFLVSGKSFDGLSIINEENRKLKETKIVRNSVFPYSQFIDISRDGFPDIAAFNVASLSLDLFYNKGNGEFRMVRSIPYSENIYSLRAFDMDLDSTEDLIISKERSIEILYTNQNSNFDIRKIKTEYNPEKLIEGDFNKDGNMDIAYLDTKSGVLSILFGRMNRDFFPEVIYFKKKGSMDIIPFYSKFIHGIAVINELGRIYFISNFTTESEESDIVLGINQQGLNYFDHNHDGIPDICFIDNAEMKLNLILRNTSGVPSVFYSFPLTQKATKIYTDYFEKYTTTFYCYTVDDKLIESFKIDFTKSSVEKKSFYVQKGIKSIKTDHNSNNDVKLSVVQLNNGKLSLTVYNSITLNYLNTNYLIADNVINVSTGKENFPAFYFWRYSSDSLILYRANYNNNFENPEVKYININKDVDKILSFTGDFVSNDKDNYFSIIHSHEFNQSLTISGNSVNLVNKKEIIDELVSKGINRFYVARYNFRGLDKVFYYAAVEEKIKKVDFSNKGKNILVSVVADVQNVGDYFIKNMNMRNFHLVYTNMNENCITIKQLQ